MSIIISPNSQKTKKIKIFSWPRTKASSMISEEKKENYLWPIVKVRLQLRESLMRSGGNAKIKNLTMSLGRTVCW